MSTVQSTDKVLVQRAATLHSAPADMSTVQDTDLLLINRAGVDYKCSFADWKASQTGINKPSITSPTAGAVDLGETPTFTSSAFSGTGTTHVSSDWQVTLKTDAAFAAPVVQSMADTTNKTSWDGGPLSTNTDYIVRVRYHGAGALVSPWSDAVGFKTKAVFVSVIPASDVVIWNGTTLTAVALPAKAVNAGSTNSLLVAIGVDNTLYTIDKATAAVTTVGSFSSVTPAGTAVVAGAVGYNGTLAMLDSNGGLHMSTSSLTTTYTPLPNAAAASVSMSTGTSDSGFAISTTKKKLYFGYSIAGSNVKLDGNSFHCAVAGWNEVTTSLWDYIFTRNTSAIVQCTCNYDASATAAAAYFVLGVSATVYADGEMYIGTTQIPRKAGSSWVQVFPTARGSNKPGSYMALNALGEVWFFDNMHTPGAGVKFADNAATPICGYEGGGPHVYLGSDGIWYQASAANTKTAIPGMAPVTSVHRPYSALNNFFPPQTHMGSAATAALLLPKLS